jgi:predicted aldo/keto reductase-like oxidoreductase
MVSKTRKQKRGKKTRKHRGGGNNNNSKSKPLEQMPQICFGTNQANLKKRLPQALEIGYRHIDGAEAYGDIKKTIKESIKDYKRNELWITWKSDQIDVDHIKGIIRQLECGYIDLFLVHHGCGEDADFEEFKKAKDQNLIRFYGVSNCEDLAEIEKLKQKHGIYANQIQARPPGGHIKNRGDMVPNFIEESNKLGVHIMIFATNSSLQGAVPDKNIETLFEVSHNITNYYIQKYLKPFNVLMTSSVGGGSLKQNYENVERFLKGEDLLQEEDMKKIEKFLLSLTLKLM